MSALHSFEIIAKHDNVITVEVKMIHSDERQIVDSYDFALQILVEFYEFTKLGYWETIAYIPIPQAILASRLTEANVELLESLLQKMRGKNSQNEPDYHEFCTLAAQHIQCLEVMSVHQYPHWPDRFETWLQTQKKPFELTQADYDAHPESKEIPSYRLRITVAPENNFLLRHVITDCKWESACYSFQNYAHDFIPSKSSICHCLNYSTNSTPLADEALQQWWGQLSVSWQRIFFKNMLLQQFELPSDLLPYSLNQMIEHIIKDEPNATLPLHELRLMPQLKYLNASFFYDITHLAPLQLTKELLILEAQSGGLTDISDFIHLPQLQYLNIFGCDNIRDYSPLKHLTQLRDLAFNPSNFEDLSVVQSLPHLQRLSLSTLTFALDFAFFESLPSLKKLHGYALAVSEKDLASLQRMTQKGIEIQWEVYNEATDEYEILTL